jgi:hypothetical protein
MDESAGISWVELLNLMVHGPDPSVRGMLRSFDGTDGSRQYFGWSAVAGEPRPVFAGTVAAGAAEQDGELEPLNRLRIWRNGRRVRICQGDGSPNLIVNDEYCWQFEPGEPVPVRSPARAVRYLVNGTNLLTRRDPNDFAGNDFTRPTGPVGATTFLGRPAWTVELAPPSHKPYPMQLVVDAETGLVLQQRNDGFGSVDEWTEFVVGESLPEELFSWDGPSRSASDELARREAEHDTMIRQRSEWFTANVAPLPLRLELELDVLVHEYDEDTGAFQASLGTRHLGMLARRPATESGEWELHWSEPGHRWRDKRWEWAVNFYDDDISERGLAALRRQLGENRQ